MKIGAYSILLSGFAFTVFGCADTASIQNGSVTTGSDLMLAIGGDGASSVSLYGVSDSNGDIAWITPPTDGGGAKGIALVDREVGKINEVSTINIVPPENLPPGNVVADPGVYYGMVIGDWPSQQIPPAHSWDPPAVTIPPSAATKFLAILVPGIIPNPPVSVPVGGSVPPGSNCGCRPQSPVGGVISGAYCRACGRDGSGRQLVCGGNPALILPDGTLSGGAHCGYPGPNFLTCHQMTGGGNRFCYL